MSTLFAMTLPGLVVILVVAGAIDVVLTRRRKHRDRSARPAVAGAAVDVLGLAFSPGARHKLEHDQFLELDRQQEGEGAPPRSRVDLDAGTARIVIPLATDEPRS